LNSNETVEAVRAAADRIGERLGLGEALKESLLRDHLACELARRTDDVVEVEKTVLIREFRGVGPVDIVVRNPTTHDIVGMIECKWSSDPNRDKIYEAAWDAIKLALAALAIPGALGFLVTGATARAWQSTEVIDLFATGVVSTRALWDRPIDPAGLNHTTTVGGSCEAGGRGNMFTNAPEHLEVEFLAETPIAGTDWIIKLSRVAAQAGGQLIKFGQNPEFPQRMSQSWLEQHVPGMPEDEYQRLLNWLRLKAWTDQELTSRVHPLRESPSSGGPSN
jgi:hypothetical protein